MWHKTRLALKCLLIACLVAVSAGCLVAQYEDISRRPEYAGLIDTSYRLREVMLIHGVTLDTNYKRVVDVYSITPRPGIAGPEILSQDQLPVGTLVRVVGVLGCTNCIVRGGDRLAVALPDFQKYGKHRTIMGFSFGGNDLVVKGGGKTLLNSAFFEYVR